MVYHCTAYSNMVFTGQVLSLASSQVQRVKCKEITQVDDVHCTLGNFNHPIYLQRTGFKEETQQTACESTDLLNYPSSSSYM